MHDFHFFSPMPSKTFQFPFLKFKESFCFSWVALRERTSQFVFGQTIYIFDCSVPILFSNLPARNRSKDSAWEIALLKVCKHTLHAEKKLSLLTSEQSQFLNRRHNCREEPEEREETGKFNLQPRGFFLKHLFVSLALHFYEKYDWHGHQLWNSSAHISIWRTLFQELVATENTGLGLIINHLLQS